MAENATTKITTQVKVLAGVVVALGLVLVLMVVLLVTKDGGDATASSTPITPTTPQAGGSTAPGAGSGSSSPSGDPSDAPPGLESFYGQQLDWQPCGKVECAQLTVPIDYKQPTGKTIQLALKRTQATDPSQRVGSLVVNPGGPGAPGTTMVDDASFYFTPTLLAREDIVAFDPRGTGESDPISCLSDSEIDAFTAEDPTPSTPAEVSAYTAEQKKFWKGCVADSDELIGHVSTVEAAMDMDVLRSALAEPKLDYLGFSYGTKLGATYADLYPDNVGRMVLDGAVDPKLGFKQASLTQAGGFETALRSYVQNCLDGGSCFLGSSMDAALKTITDLLDSIGTKPLPVSDGRKLTEGNAFYGIVTPLYSKDNWTYLDQALQQALNGDGTTLMLLADSYASRNPDGSYADNSVEAFPAISCLDDPSSIPPGQVPSYYAEFEKASPTFGKVFAWGLEGCRGIQVKAEYPAPKIDAPGAPPIVVLGTTRDPATPFAEAKALASQLDSGVLVSRDGDGHTAYNKGNSCIDDAVEGFLLDDTVPKNGLSC